MKNLLMSVFATSLLVLASCEKEPMEYSEQDTEKFQSIMTVKVDGHPWIASSGFDRSKMEDIRKAILKVEGVLSYNVNPDNISAL